MKMHDELLPEEKREERLSIWKKVSVYVLGFLALVWFLIRVIPKPSRASYPCQRTAFPMASAFVIWLSGSVFGFWSIKQLKTKWMKNKTLLYLLLPFIVVVGVIWVFLMPLNIKDASAIDLNEVPAPAIGFDWQPAEINTPVGNAKGIFPGRVVMSRDPEATKWQGNWKKNEDQWWLDKNTDVEKVGNMLSLTLNKLTGVRSNKKAWNKLFTYYNEKRRGLKDRGYKDDEIVAVKINLNNSKDDKIDNEIDASPQMVLALVRQLVNKAKVPEDKILVYDARRPVYPAMLTCVWKEFPSVRFMQQDPATEKQPFNPITGDHSKLENANWVEGISYSSGRYKRAKLIPQQIIDATYIINMAILKAHSYPYNYMSSGDEGQTAITMCGKNHCGSIRGTSELYAILNTKKKGVKNAYSPLVDLAASPNLGAKTILFILDGLYCGRKWRSYPIHFPNPPFNNRAEPYENSDWPSCLLASQDGVALESVGLDILYAQSKNNIEPSYHNVSRILIRENADDFLREMAIPENAPSGTKYIQNGNPVTSLGVHEHWDSDATMRYSRNIDPDNGMGIEFIYIPIK